MGKDDRQGDPTDEPPATMNMLHMTADLVPSFSGRDKTYSITRWIQDVEDHAEIFSWSPLQQLLVARRALTGTAALWLRAERPHKSWEDLKTALGKEFTDTVDVKTIHEMMSARKKMPDESCLDYMLVMKELGKRGKMADYVAIKYVIDGIVDLETNKMMLYGVNTYGDLKEKLKIYETIKEKTSGGSNGNSIQQQQNMHASRQADTRKCFNCGEHKHISMECPHKTKGVKCFNCNSFGHVSSKCSAPRPGGSGVRSDVATSSQQRERAGNTGRLRSTSESANNRNLSTYCCDREMERTRLSDVEGDCDNDGQDGGAGDQSEDDVCSADVMNVNNVGGQMKVVKKPLKSLQICGKFVDALMDTGSDVSLLSMECYRSLGSPKYEQSDITMTGLGATKVRAIGVIKTTVLIDGQTFQNVLFHIVPKGVMPYSIIVGQNLLQSTVMVMDNNRVILLPANEEWFRSVMYFVSDLDVIGHEVSPGLQERVRHMMMTYVPARTKEALIELRIHLKDDIPVAQRPRRLALKEQQEVDVQIQQWLNDNIIRVSTSEYSSPLVLVRKKDGSLRICVDYRKLNEKMVKDQYPLPIIDSHIDKCQKAKIFSALDLENGYFYLHKQSILKVQGKNSRSYNKKRKESRRYIVGDVVAIRKTQYGVCTKIKPKYLGPYSVTAIKGRDRYDVEKLDSAREGPGAPARRPTP